MGIDVDIDVDAAACFLGARLTCLASHSNVLHCSWRICARARAFEDSLLDSLASSVKVSLILDLESTTALSLHDLCNLLCCELQTLPDPATGCMCALRPEEHLQFTGEFLQGARQTVRCALCPVARSCLNHLQLAVVRSLLSFCRACRHGLVLQCVWAVCQCTGLALFVA